jgi:(p)ppGpp synthase/HD superfamily hydrolase
MNFLLIEAEAMKFVDEHHRNQFYGEGEHQYPYHFHLYQVASIAKKYNMSEDVIIACIGHDLLEDTSVSYNAVKRKFGERVADIVYLVTDHKGKNRKEKHLKTYPEIAQDVDATSVKLCDRYANQSFGIATENFDKMSMYVKEHDDFVRILNVHSIHSHLWDELENNNIRAKRKLENINTELGYKKYKF